MEKLRFLVFVSIFNKALAQQPSQWIRPPPGGDTVTFNEDVPIGTLIYQLQGYDPDGPVSFINLDAVFTLGGGDNSRLQLAAQFDYETAKSKTISIFVYEPPGGNWLPNSLTINIAPVNEFEPIFNPDVYSKTIQENNAADIEIAILTCSDQDATVVNNPPVTCPTFAIQSGDDTPNKFKVVGNRILTSSNSIDYDVMQAQNFMYTLIVIGMDETQNGVQRTGTATVRVTIDPINEHTPTFTGATNFSIPENTAPGTEVHDLNAVDADVGIHGDLTFAIIGGNADGKFLIVPKTGKVFTTGYLDYHTTNSYKLRVSVTDGGAQLSTTDVDITVTSVNDNEPNCSPNIVTTAVDEDLPIGTTVAKFTCSDSDAGDVLTYNITSGDFGYFEITSSGEVNVSKALGYDEGYSSYNLNIMISDGLHEVATWAFININPVNEYRPIFQLSPNVTVNENETVGYHIIRYTASDADASPHGISSYQINSVTNGGGSTFQMDETSAEIHLANLLDYETVQTYEITVVATDGGSLKATGTVTVSIVNINDNSPSCTKSAYIKSVPEDSAINTVVISDLGCKDRDKDALTYNLIQTPPDNTFAINASGYVYTQAALDYETTPFYYIEILVSDGIHNITTHVTINVENVNEAAPVFTNGGKYDSTLSENSPIGVEVIKVTATDKDLDRISYIFDTVYPKFLLDSQNGDILLGDKLDRELIALHELHIVASDGQRSSTATVTVRVSDVNEPPMCAHASYSLAIDENSPSGTFVGNVSAVDADVGGTNGKLQYKMLSGNVNSQFQIDPNDGTIFVATSTDYEATKTVLLRIEVKDLGSPPLSEECTVTININDKNDNAPSFLTSTLTERLSEDAAIGKEVTRVLASDRDSSLNNNNQFVFSSQSPVPFEIHPSTGIVTVDGKLDRETHSNYNMVINAIDKGTPPLTGTVTLVITLTDVNDNSPVINGSYETTISENVPVNSIVFAVTAEDNDEKEFGKIGYSIVSGNFNSNFKIDENTGVVQVASPLNRESKSLYKLVIKVSDYGVPPMSASVTATVSIEDVNDFSPTFLQSSYSFSVYENVPLNTVVGKIEAVDKDSGINSYLTYTIATYWTGNDSNFQINTTSGEIFTNGDIDREIESFYSIWCRVTDGGNPSMSSEVTVNINVQDINDKDPVFKRDSYSTAIFENLSAGSKIMTTGAFDEDLGENSELIYELDMSTPEGMLANYYFYVQATNGDIFQREKVDYEAYSEITMLITVKDRGVPQRKSYANVTIYIEDVNDNAPVFYPPFYNAEASRVDVCKAVITTVMATDKDQGKNSAVVYVVKSPSGLIPFELNTQSGKVTAKSYLTGSKYIITVDARDNGEPKLTSEAEAKIRIDTFNADEIIISFYLQMNIFAYLIFENEFLNQVKITIADSYPTAYVRRWCIEDRVLSVIVHVYAVKNDMTHSIKNLNIVKPFMTNGELLQLLNLDQNKIPLSNKTGQSWSRFSVTKVEPYGDAIIFPTSNSNTQGDSSVSASVPIGVSLALMAVLVAVGILFLLAWKKRWFRKKRSDDKNRLRVQITETRRDDITPPLTPYPGLKHTDETTDSDSAVPMVTPINHQNSIENEDVSKTELSKSETKSVFERNATILTTNDKCTHTNDVTSDVKRNTSPSDVTMKTNVHLYIDESDIQTRDIKGPFIAVPSGDIPKTGISSPSLIHLGERTNPFMGKSNQQFRDPRVSPNEKTSGIRSTSQNAVSPSPINRRSKGSSVPLNNGKSVSPLISPNQQHEPSPTSTKSGNKESTPKLGKRGVDPVTGWTYEENPESHERRWIKSPETQPTSPHLPFV